MAARFEELDWRDTSMGLVSLRRRWDLALNVEVYEVKLDDEFLMSSLFTVAEVELARLGLSALAGSGLDVAVGGLGLGFTASAVLEDSRVRSVRVVEALEPVIDWHRRELLPLAPGLMTDPRAQLVHADFFELIQGRSRFESSVASQRFHSILVDIDHSPSHVLHASHAELYQQEGLRRLADRLHPGGVFALWSNDPPEEDFNTALAEAFATSEARIVSFDNHQQAGTSSNTVYLAQRAAADDP